jgi:Flp pilus assembly protein TadG
MFPAWVTLQEKIRSLRSRSQSGAAAIEFAVVAPVLFLLLCGIIETGVIFFADSTLQNATDDTARLVRTGQAQNGNMTQAQFVAHVCGEMSGLLPLSTCEANLAVDMQSFSNFSTMGFNPVLNPNGSLNLGNMQYQPGTACQVVLVRAFYPWTIMTPLMSPLLQNVPGGKYLLTASATFRNEPYMSGSTC